MKSFKQYIKDRQEIQEGFNLRKFGRSLSRAAGIAAVMAGLQAGAMHKTEIPQVSTQSSSIQHRGNEKRTVTLDRSAYAKQGKKTEYIKRGFLDTKDNTVTDTAQGLPTRSRITVSLSTPEKTTTASKEQRGNKVEKTGKIGQTQLSGPAEEETVSKISKTNSFD